MKIWLRIVSFLRKHFQKDKIEKDSNGNPEAPRKNYIDAAMDAEYGTEGGEGKQWPHIRI